MSNALSTNYAVVNKAFSKQSANYDADDQHNKVLQDMRRQVYDHVNRFIKSGSHILELNAGTGIDALYFAREGHHVHATDLSDGMIAAIENKIAKYNDVHGRMTCQQLSYDELQTLSGKKYDYIFSNFGGLNCIDDLSKVTQHLPALLNDGAFVTWVIMPKICLWEMLWLLKGHPRAAARRFQKNGVMAHLEGEYFKTYYYSLPDVRKAFGKEFKFVKSEGLCLLSPPPSRGDFPNKHPTLYKCLRAVDSMLNKVFPFNRSGDHLIVTFQFCST